MNRRDFLKSNLCLPALSLLPHFIPFVSFSEENEPQFFIQFFIDGGWDTTLATEAWNFQTKPDSEKIFIEYSENDVLPFGKEFVGPALAPLKPFFNRKDDIIVEIGDLNTRITESAIIGHLLLSNLPGEKIPSVVLRGGQRVKLELPQQ